MLLRVLAFLTKCGMQPATGLTERSLVVRQVFIKLGNQLELQALPLHSVSSLLDAVVPSDLVLSSPILS